MELHFMDPEKLAFLLEHESDSMQTMSPEKLLEHLETALEQGELTEEQVIQIINDLKPRH